MTSMHHLLFVPMGCAEQYIQAGLLFHLQIINNLLSGYFSCAQGATKTVAVAVVRVLQGQSLIAA